ncbi:MAG: hypothetical protein OK436_04190 [Thaumarchaeota archaeon]|nr:hypothetical protein [Nitrososphaerota archaeon]
MVIFKKRHELRQSALSVIAVAEKIVDPRVHQPKDGNMHGRCEICNERWPCLQSSLKKALVVWEKISA